MIESYVPERALTLVRNPYFRVWSSVARPDGFPDEIVLRWAAQGTPASRPSSEGGRRRGVLRSDRGRSRRSRPSGRAHPSQVHLHPEQATVIVFLNATHPPFDDVRVRRAVNYAVDRAAISASYRRSERRPADVSAPPAGHGWLPALLPLHRRPEPDGRVEGARPDGVHAASSPHRGRRA